MTSQHISQSTNTKVLIVCLCFSVLFTMTRAAARWYKIRRIPLAPEDWTSYLALASYITLCALYLASLTTYYNAIAVEAGTLAPYPSLEDDLTVLVKEFLTVQFFFWLTLWGVKWSLLCMFKILTTGLIIQVRIWWGVMIFTWIAYAACCVTQFTSCSSIHAWLTAGLCDTPEDARRQWVALYFSLGADLLTDMLVMAIPIRLLWNLRISAMEKVGLCLIFAVGIITMILAVVRAVSLNSSIDSGQIDTSWIMLWAAIEGLVAILVCCLPSFVIVIRSSRVEKSHSTQFGHNSTSVGNQESRFHSSNKRSRIRSESILLSEVDPTGDVADGSSKKSLIDNSIVVTQGWSQTYSGSEGKLRTEDGV